MKDMFGIEKRKEKDLDGRKVILYGRKPYFCRDCKFFYKEEYAKTYTRCKKFPEKYWPALMSACGLFEQCE